MGIVDEAADAAGEMEISDAEAIYSALAAVFADTPKETVFKAALAVQDGKAWETLAPEVRDLFEDVADELFDEDGEGADGADEDETEKSA